MTLLKNEHSTGRMGDTGGGSGYLTLPLQRSDLSHLTVKYLVDPVSPGWPGHWGRTGRMAEPSGWAEVS